MSAGKIGVLDLERTWLRVSWTTKNGTLMDRYDGRMSPEQNGDDVLSIGPQMTHRLERSTQDPRLCSSLGTGVWCLDWLIGCIIVAEDCGGLRQ